MSFTFNIYNESGTAVSGHGTVVETLDFNMLKSGDRSLLYYPHDAAANAPLVRPTALGDLNLSYKVYTYFKISGTYTKIKNLKLKIQVSNAAQATKAMLYYKLTNTYATPDASFDGSMLPVYDGAAFTNGDSELVLTPNWSTSGPSSATSRQLTYGPNQTLYSQYLVTQLYAANSAATGNTAEFKARIEFIEFQG